MNCESCVLRKATALMLDLHWLGEDDCPYECPYKEDQNEQGGKT